MGPGLAGGPRAGSWRRGLTGSASQRSCCGKERGPGWGRSGFKVTESAARASTEKPRALREQARGRCLPTPEKPGAGQSGRLWLGEQVLRAVRLQVLHGGPGHAVPVHLLQGDQGPPGGGNHAVSQRDGLPAHLHPRGRVQLWPVLRLLGPGSRGQHPQLPDLWVHHCLTHSAPPPPAPPAPPGARTRTTQPRKPREPTHTFRGYHCPRPLYPCPR